LLRMSMKAYHAGYSDTIVWQPEFIRWLQLDSAEAAHGRAI
jgi:hypothetical protein